jgi:hypothetical protein
MSLLRSWFLIPRLREQTERQLAITLSLLVPDLSGGNLVWLSV